MLIRPLIAAAVLLFATGAEAATAPPGRLALELNALQPSDQACRVTFLATNELGAALGKATFELAIFGKDGGISRVVSADFAGLTDGKTKVLQFDLKSIACGDISRILINDVTACVGDGVAPGACLALLTTSNKTAVAFGV